MKAPSLQKANFSLLDRADVPVVQVATGVEIVRQGSAATQMFVVKSGTAEIRVGGKTVEEVGPGGVFGEMALIDREPRSATVVAREPCEIIPIDERLFVVLVQDTPYFALDVMRILVARLRAMNSSQSERA